MSLISSLQLFFVISVLKITIIFVLILSSSMLGLVLKLKVGNGLGVGSLESVNIFAVLLIL